MPRVVIAAIIRSQVPAPSLSPFARMASTLGLAVGLRRVGPGSDEAEGTARVAEGEGFVAGAVVGHDAGEGDAKALVIGHRGMQEMEKRSRRCMRDLVALSAFRGLSQNESGRARISWWPGA